MNNTLPEINNRIHILKAERRRMLRDGHIQKELDRVNSAIGNLKTLKRRLYPELEVSK